MDSDKIVIVSNVIAKPDWREELIDVMRHVRDVDEAREPATIVQSFQYERDNPNHFWEYVVYANKEARDIHRRHRAELIRRETGHMHVRPPETVMCVPLFAKGIDLS